MFITRSGNLLHRHFINLECFIFLSEWSVIGGVGGVEEGDGGCHGCGGEVHGSCVGADEGVEGGEYFCQISEVFG